MRRTGAGGDYWAMALVMASTVILVRSSTIFFAISSVLLIGSRLTPLMVARLALALFLSGDNLRKGAAVNAVQIAEALLARRS
jgi:hypothetical protein